uniref:RING-type domain-containing protein n=1 Tax=viral metagenome TaxID=1070528 RepID=A0A6C0J2R8_9ZZZZ
MTSEDSHALQECDHRFHTNCILKWFRSKQETCPLCREPPLVKLKAPDIFHRAKTLIQKEKDGLTSDSFVKDRINVISESERIRLIHEKDLLQHKELFKNVIKPRKEDLRRQYRILRTQFKDKSSPILKQLDEMDEKEHAERRRIKKSISQEQKKKRQALRDIGLHNIETLEAARPDRVYNFGVIYNVDVL